MAQQEFDLFGNPIEQKGDLKKKFGANHSPSSTLRMDCGKHGRNVGLTWVSSPRLVVTQ